MNKKVKACPVSLQQVDQHLVKTYSFIVFSILTYVLITGVRFPVYIITLDFMIRVFAGIKYSPFCFLIRKSLKLTGIPPKMIDSQRKRIAAQFGLAFSIFITLFFLTGFNFAARIVIIVFITAILLDLIFNYCLACTFNSLYLRMKHRYFS